MDLDGDGHLDILSGSYSRMDKDMAGLFQVLPGNAKGQFAKAQVLKGTDGQPLIIPKPNKEQITEAICTRPMAVDWDGDGDLDLVVGNFAGTFYLFEGKGKGRFEPKPKKLKAGKQDLRIQGAHSDPFVIDWDGDGDLDILSGTSSGGVMWAENQAKKGAEPVLKQFRFLIQPGKLIPYGSMLSEKDLNGPGPSTRVWVDDVNKDGKLDILVGDSVYLMAPAKGLTKQQFQKRQAAWQKKQETIRAELNKPNLTVKERQAVGRRYGEHYRNRSEFVDEDRTGFVWLYLQK